MDWLKTLVPLLGTALGGPLGGAAASFIANKLGIEDTTIEAVSEILTSGKMTPEQISQVKLAEIDFKKFLEENKIDVMKLEVQNTQGARDMQMSIRSYVPASLSVMVTFGFFGILAGMMTGSLSTVANEPMLIMLGALGAAWGSVINYWFGSSSGSADKSKLLATRA